MKHATTVRVAGRSLALSLLGALALVAGCRQDMQDQPKFVPQRGTTLFADGRSARPQVEHTVARGGDTLFLRRLANGEGAEAAEWIADMRTRHEAMLTTRWTETTSIAFFEMNASFHEGIAAGSGNRHFLAAIQRDNRLRRLSNYYWKHNFDRVRANHSEHMAILDSIEAKRLDIAASLMRAHLQVAGTMPFHQAPPKAHLR